MRTRKLPLGDRNLIGERVTEARTNLGISQVELTARLQAAGLDIGTSCISKLEGQTKLVTDKELVIIAQVLNVSVTSLLGLE